LSVVMLSVAFYFIVMMKVVMLSGWLLFPKKTALSIDIKNK
jgi:hypothetical protein